MECVASPPINPSTGRLTSGFGMRVGRTSGQPSFHAGNDFNARRGDPVFAVRRGVVQIVSHDDRPHQGFRGYGNAVVIHHPLDGVWSLSAHLSQTLVAPGHPVVAGQLIGRVGATHNGQFPGMPAHLHFETRFMRGDGSSPFPGEYRRYNIDPQIFLREIEVGNNWRGRFSLGRSVCRPWMTPGLSGLGAIALGNQDQPARAAPDAEMLGYEPPRDDWRLSLFGSNWALGAVVGGGVILTASALGLADWDTRRQRARRR